MTERPHDPLVDPSHNLFHVRDRPLDAIFSPRSIAVVGASETPQSVGRTLLWNLISNPFGGTVYPVNPKRTSVLGIRAYPSVGEIPDEVDLAVIATPAPTVPGLIRECVEKDIRGAIIISAGFKEIGEEGHLLERQIKEEAGRGSMRIVGPNVVGIMRPTIGLNATFARGMARPGNVAFVSQSGALLTGILDWSFSENVGFSSFVSVGSMLDVGWGDLITYLGDDPATRSILVYMESIGDARSFLSAARYVAREKPIIVIKAGRTEEAARAAASHTGTLTGSDEVLTAAFRRSGVLRVDSIADLFYMAEVLAKQPRPSGSRLSILTNAGGPGVLATDALISGGGALTPISERSMAELDDFLPPAWSRGNPIDVLGDADEQRYTRALEIAEKDEHSDGLLVVLTPQDMTDPTAVAESVARYVQSRQSTARKPVIASWMGGASVAAGENILNQAGIPTFSYPDTAARVFNYMWRYSYNLRALYETPSVPGLADDRDAREATSALIETARGDGRELLTEHESKQVLQAYGLPTTGSRLVTTADEAAAAADEIGYPAVLKLHSYSITHKTDVGGVRLNLGSPEAVRRAFDEMRQGLDDRGLLEGFDGATVQPMIRQGGYELIIGSSVDPQFGPVLLFGAGGTMVEIFRDRALALPPLTTTLARRMMEQTNIYRALQGVRGRKPVDLDALEKMLVRFSQLVVEQPMIKEIDINPLLASEDGMLALDARVVLHPAGTREEDLPRTAIRPYPHRYASSWTMSDGAAVTIRPIRPEDELALANFHTSLSEESVYLRYANMIKLSQRVAHERLSHLCFIDYDREMALVAERLPEDGEDAPEIVGVARLTKIGGTNDGEFALLIGDRWQGRGLGTEMLKRLVEIGQDEGLDRVSADVLRENAGMRRVSEHAGFRPVLSNDGDDPTLRIVRQL